jgi:hypothetical protein
VLVLRPADEETLTILPEPLAFINGNTALVQRNTPVTLIVIINSHSWRGMFSNGVVERKIPALLTRMSTLPS